MQNIIRGRERTSCSWNMLGGKVHIKKNYFVVILNLEKKFRNQTKILKAITKIKWGKKPKIKLIDQNTKGEIKIAKWILYKND